ncbi:uncharacterized protein LW93_8866 [Fusarium fujikuroi]|nr:uncharacterized protein LW93_8866 [Fusarium fujikuroi]
MQRKAQKAYRNGIGSKALWVATSIGKAQCKPRSIINMPALVHNRTTFASEEEKQNCIRNFIWTATSDCAPPELPFPDLSPDREELEMDMTLADRGVATWFLRVIHLFLSDRSIVLKLPQSVSDPFLISIGIPQGSRLSPLLFLFYTTPLLIILAEEIKKLDWPYVEVYVFAYVDDTYIMAVSPSYEENCSILKVFHDLIMKWAKDAHLSFSPEKSLVMHFRPGVSDAKQKSDQRKREALGLIGPPKVKSPCTLLPDIDELRNNPKCLQPEKLLVLGLMLDPKLSFEHHLTHIEEKVETALMYQRRISGANWGMTLEKTRQYYICKIRPVISYACAAWFVWRPCKPGLPGLHRSLPPGQIARLQKLQYKCIKLLSGAIRGTAQVVLEKECYIDSIEFFLYRMSRSWGSLLNQKS